jgi:hypothetical protein
MCTVHTRMFPATRVSRHRGQTVPRPHHHPPAACTTTTITWEASWQRLRLQNSVTTIWETCPPVLMLAATQATMCSSCSIWASQVSRRTHVLLQAGPRSSWFSYVPTRTHLEGITTRPTTQRIPSKHTNITALTLCY